MSRSNQTETINPCTRWMEWNGEKGCFKYYDKEKKQQIELPYQMSFILLDQLSTVKGWDDANQCGIFSNEVKDINKEPMLVKSFKGGSIANGLYKEIREKIIASSAHFVSSLYLGYKSETGELLIGNIQFKGAALNAWVEFANKNRAELYKKSIKVVGIAEGKKGRTVYQTPVFAIGDISEETNAKAIELDKILQEHLSKYLAKNSVAKQVETTANRSEIQSEELMDESSNSTTPQNDDLPF